MPILYTLIARGMTVLAEYTDRTGNFTTLSRAVLEKISSNTATKMTYMLDEHRYHYIVKDNITYLCLADHEPTQRLVFAYLEDIKDRFQGMFRDRAQTAIAFQMNSEFSPVIKQRMAYFNSGQADQFAVVRKKMQNTKDVLVEDINKLFDRSERIELLVDKSEKLNETAGMFERSSRDLRRTMWWKSVKMRILFVFIAIIVIYIIVSLICGFNFKRCGAGGGNK